MLRITFALRLALNYFYFGQCDCQKFIWKIFKNDSMLIVSIYSFFPEQVKFTHMPARED